MIYLATYWPIYPHNHPCSTDGMLLRFHTYIAIDDHCLQ